eukprot:TRINITY_DN12976_c0_g2_i2.p1 TRINITY_DN12976_c0_g2~~TRINITY_DN12976_c0_g2_i2.p1  ORF type:complete len:536 (+),score=86.66 TRINITY_DN12976_c0_g2_i2:54-1610(+)
MSSVSCKKAQRAGDLRLKGTFIDIVSNDMDSPRAMSDPGSANMSSCYFESELRYIEDLSSAFTSLNGAPDSADASSSNEVEASPQDLFQMKAIRIACLQENLPLLQMNVQEKWATPHEKPGERGHHETLSVIRAIPDGVGAMVHANASFLVDGIIDEVLEISGEIHGRISSESASSSDTHAQSLVLKAVDKLPDVIRSKLDIHIAAAHQKVADLVDVVVQDLEGRVLDQSELAEATHGVAEQVQEMFREKVEACIQDSFDYATQKMSNALHSLGESKRTNVAKPFVARAQIASDVLQAARGMVVHRMELARHKVVQKNVTSTLANEAVAETLLRAKATCDSGAAHGQALHNAIDLANEISPGGENSSGSVGHPEMCARPCIYYAQGTCTKGDSCGFCHLPHDGRVAHLDKKGREQIKSMSLEQRVATLLPIIRKKAIHLRLHHDCVQAIDDILVSQTSDAHVGKSLVGQIQRGACTKFSIRALLGMLKTDTQGESLDLQDKLQDLSYLLRSSCEAATA